ncbi:ABC transporter substrate-binding protein [Streptosporangium sp. NPDC051022]|uniref:ABC transporter substrate-binding protein n=1 Tax=Streptosporangium sp. NPDC051022 TaxID=3155752 RepID=UPI003434130A
MSASRTRRGAVLAMTVLAVSITGACAVGDGSAGGTAATPVADRAGAPLTSGFPASVTAACQSDASPTIAEIRKRGELRWGIGVSPPFGFKQTDGSWGGVEADNAQELAAILGVRPAVQDYDYSLMTVALQTKKADIVGAQLFITPERAKAVDFSTPYYLSGQLFYVLADSAFQSVDDMNKAGVRFVYGTGGGQASLAEKYIPKAKVSDAPLRGQLLLYEFLASGQADASMVEAAPMAVLLKQYRSPALAAIGLKGRVTGERAQPDEVIDPFKVAFGLAKNDPGWQGCVNAWVADATASGRMDKRIDYWLAQNIAG